MKTSLKNSTTILLLILLIFSSACAKEVTITNDDDFNLKILYWDETVFNQKYSSYIFSQFPKANIQVISLQDILNKPNKNKEYVDLINEQNPDIIMVPDMKLYQDLASSNTFSSLTSLIEKDKYDIKNMSGNILETLTVDGTLFGLAPTFTNLAVYYNKDIFDKFNVQYPTNNMSWESLLDTIQNFSHGDNQYGAYGLYSSLFKYNPVNLITVVAGTEGINYINGNSKTLTANTPAWEGIYNKVINAYKSGAVYTNSNDDKSDNNLFLEGKAAITLDSVSLVQNLENNKTETFNWGIASAPLEAGKTGLLSIPEIFTINSKSANQEQAWELIQYINSEKLTKIKSKTEGQDLSTRKISLSSSNGTSLEPFYMGKSNYSYLNDLSNIPTDFFSEFYLIQINQIENIIKNKQSVKEALQAIQNDGEVELKKQLSKK